jgi:hypothetical protein
MMQAIKHLSSGLDLSWEIVGTTPHDVNNTAWGFDRWRLYYPENTMVALARAQTACDNTELYYDESTGRAYYIGGEVYQPQLFHSGGGWTNDVFEHDFTFDLSAIPTADPNEEYTTELYILIKNIPEEAEFQQIYATPTGYGATRGKNANIISWDFNLFGVGENVGGSSTSILFGGQPLDYFFLVTSTFPIKAKTIDFSNCQFDGAELDELLQCVDLGGVSNGTLKYNGNLDPPSANGRPYYDNLISRGWTITGTPPPTS